MGIMHPDSQAPFPLHHAQAGTFPGQDLAPSRPRTAFRFLRAIERATAAPQ
jgi:hypothetical protein